MTGADTGRDQHIDPQAVRDRLADNAFLFEDPDAYTAGVDDALQLVIDQLGEVEPDRLIVLDQ